LQFAKLQPGVGFSAQRSESCEEQGSQPFGELNFVKLSQ